MLDEREPFVASITVLICSSTFETLLPRKSIKGIVMRLFYSEGDNSRIKLFYEFYELNFKIDEIEITEVLKKKVMSFLNKSFMSFFCSFCPKYFELKKFFDDIFITENIE